MFVDFDAGLASSWAEASPDVRAARRQKSAGAADARLPDTADAEGSEQAGSATPGSPSAEVVVFPAYDAAAFARGVSPEESKSKTCNK